MFDEHPSSPTTESVPAKDGGTPGRMVSGLHAFQGGPANGDRAATGKSDRRPEKDEKKKVVAGPNAKPAPPPLPRKKSDQEEADALFHQEMLAELLITVTEERAEDMYEVCRRVTDEDRARYLANKVLLTDREKKCLSQLANRLWRKWVDSEGTLSDESTAALFVANYILRNLEGRRTYKRGEVAVITPAHGTDQRPPVQRAENLNPGRLGDGKN